MENEKTKKRIALAIGDFDGMHRAHKTVVTGADNVIIYSVHNKFSLLQKSIFEKRYPNTVFADFEQIKGMTGEEFVEKVIIGKFGAGIILCGFNFAFGKNASWSALDLRKYLEGRDIWVRILEHLDFDGEPISSTRIRKAVQTGKIEYANEMLGYNFTFESQVVDGDKRGRSIGFPTINQHLPQGLVVPKFGVYESRCFVDGKAFEGGKAEHYHLTLGSGSFIPGFEDQIVGHSAGEEFDVNVTFPEQYQADELAGKPAVFKIKLHEVKYKELPALDDELAKDCSEYDTLEEFKESIRKSNQEQLDKQDDLAVENALVDQVIGGMEAEIPQAMYDVRMDELVNDFAFRVEQQGLTLDNYLKYMGQTMEQFRASFMPQAEKQVKIRLALEAVANAEKIEASEEDVNAEIKRIADQYKMEEDKVRELVNMDELKKDLAVNKAIDFIKSHANVVEKAAEAEQAADAQ